MTMTTVPAGSAPGSTRPDLTRTARITGLLYLGLALTALSGNLIVRTQLFVADNPAETLANLMDHEALARVVVVLEMGVVLTQALTALWFYRLFRSIDAFAAGLIAVFGMVNAIAFVGSTALLATARDAAGDVALAAAGDAPATVQLLYVARDHLLGVAALFFGLWLIPMGWLVVRSRWFPRLLGWTLVAGGAGYLASVCVTYLLPDAGAVPELLTVPATIGEFWILGYLIALGVRPGRGAPGAVATGL